MSIWTEMQDRGTGDAVKKEDLAVKIKEISNRILNLVCEHNDLVSIIEELENRVCYYYGLNVGERDRNVLPFLKDTEVNSILESNDYAKMKKYYINVKYKVVGLYRDKENLEKEVWRQEKIREADFEEIARKVREENRKERERMEMERREAERNETVRNLMIIPILLFVAAIYAIFLGAKSGFIGVTATGIGLGLLGIISVIMICNKVRKI